MDALAMDAFAMDAHHFHECAVVATGHPSGEAAAATGSACPRFFFWKSLGLMPLLVLYLGSTCLSVDLVVVRCFQWAQACLNLAMYNDEGRDYAKNLATKLGRPFA